MCQRNSIYAQVSRNLGVAKSAVGQAFQRLEFAGDALKLSIDIIAPCL
jgi:hypothetical protein